MSDSHRKKSRDMIGQRLRELFDDILNEPLPEEFLEFLRQADPDGPPIDAPAPGRRRPVARGPRKPVERNEPMWADMPKWQDADLLGVGSAEPIPLDAQVNEETIIRMAEQIGTALRRSPRTVH